MSKTPSVQQMKKQLAYFEKIVTRLEHVAREIGRGNTLPALEIAKESLEKNRKFAQGLRRRIAESESEKPPLAPRNQSARGRT